MFLRIIFSVFICFASFAQARDLTTAEKLSDFQQLNQMIQANYGPLQYKQDVQGINLPAIEESYRTQIAATDNNADFYYLIMQYVAEFNDGHFSARLPSQVVYSIGIDAEYVDGKILIDKINTATIPVKDFPFQKGDEIISIDGQPAADFLNYTKKYYSWGHDETDYRLGARSVFFRSAKIFPAPTKETLDLEIRRGTSNNIEKASLKWTKTGEALDEIKKHTPFFLKPVKQTISNYDNLSIQSDLIDLMGKDRLEKSFQCSGGTRTAIPKDATILMMEPFVAYYHPTEKGNVGYLRIPHYMWVTPQGQSQFEQVFAQYEWAIKKLEQNTVGLVIDQDHNCGGSVAFLENLVGLFMSEPFQPMIFQLKASKTEYLQFSSWVKEFPANSVLQESMQKVADLVKKSWIDGLFLTPKTSLFGVDYLPPHHTRYTKPIVMLIDEMSGSGGDAFPSLMQGYGRATLIGKRTSGLGGHVEEQPSLNYSGITLRMTKSLFYRPDGVAVENNGASPDIAYTITRDDFLYEYKDFQKFYLKALLNLIPTQGLSRK